MIHPILPRIKAAIHCLKTTKDIADAETFIRSLMPSEEMLTYAPGQMCTHFETLFFSHSLFDFAALLTVVPLA